MTGGGGPATARCRPRVRSSRRRCRRGLATGEGIALIEPGVVPTSKTVTLHAAEQKAVELREPEGAAIPLKVVDDEGAPAKLVLPR